MPFTWVGTGAGTKLLTDPWAGQAAAGGAPAQRRIDKIWVGSVSGVPLLVFDRYISTTSLTATAASPSQINLSWSATTGATYVLYRGSSQIYSGTGLSRSDTGLAASTTYNYRVDVFKDGSKVGESSASARTQAVPPPVYQQKAVTLSRDAYGSYTGTGAKRTDSVNLFYGMYSSNRGLQKWLATFPVPSDLRGCVSVDKVEVSIYNLHTYYNSGASVGLVVHHGSVAGSSFPGSTAICRTLTAPKPGFWGGTEWVDVTNDVCPGRTSVREEFRVNGARGIGFAPVTSSIGGYGYSRNDVRIRFTYTVRIG